MLEKCPICGAPVLPATEAYPFCSSRCRLVDLGRWLGEEYRIPAVDDDADEDGRSAPPESPAPAGPTPPTPPWRN